MSKSKSVSNCEDLTTEINDTGNVESLMPSATSDSKVDKIEQKLPTVYFHETDTFYGDRENMMEKTNVSDESLGFEELRGETRPDISIGLDNSDTIDESAEFNLSSLIERLDNMDDSSLNSADISPKMTANVDNVEKVEKVEGIEHKVTKKKSPTKNLSSTPKSSKKAVQQNIMKYMTKKESPASVSPIRLEKEEKDETFCYVDSNMPPNWFIEVTKKSLKSRGKSADSIKCEETFVTPTKTRLKF